MRDGRRLALPSLLRRAQGLAGAEAAAAALMRFAKVKEEARPTTAASTGKGYGVGKGGIRSGPFKAISGREAKPTIVVSPQGVEKERHPAQVSSTILPDREGTAKACNGDKISDAGLCTRHEAP